MNKTIILYLCLISVLQILFATEKVGFSEDFDDELMGSNYDNKNYYHNFHDREIDKMNEELLDLNKINAQLEWESAIKVSNNIFRAKEKFYSLKAMWKLRWCNKFELNQHQENIIKYNYNERRMIYLLCHRGPKYSLHEIKRLSLISDQLGLNYNLKKICRFGIDNNTEVKHCYHGEHEVKLLMQMSRNEKERRWAWTSWRNEMKNIKHLFIKSVAIQNSGARRNGYADMGVCWREEMEIPGIENLSNKLWLSIKPLYELLHAVVRFQLRKLYPGVILSATAPIPAHLIGDLWSVNWQSLADIILPQFYINITNILIKKNYTVSKMISVSEDFFTSLNFPPMTDKFRTLSLVTRRNNSINNCHGSARNMYELNDFRVLACFEVNEESFNIIHHEMGHVQYYMAYQNQPVIYQNGVNSAFHESIGDVIFLGAMTPRHLHRLGFIDDNGSDEISRIELALLLKLALTKIPQIPYALLMDKWRWRVFEGVVDSNNYNKAWWDLHRNLMGIVPPNSRPDSAEFFDPAAKYHIISNTPYLRYFLSHVLQFQIFDAMCKIAVTVDKINFHKNSNFPLYKCDIYGAKISGNKLRKVMKMGSSIKTRRAFIELLNTSEYCVDSLLKYFQPIKKFLEQQIRLNNIPIGWN